jgi:hypothetical protein
MDEFLRFAIPAVVGLITGAMGSLIAPWVSWGIEKRRSKVEARRRSIADARAELQHKPENKAFRESLLYSRLRPHLSEGTRRHRVRHHNDTDGRAWWWRQQLHFRVFSMISVI